MNIRFLETFVWLARLQNFSKTANRLYTTQPAVSSRINALEDLYGEELYIRGSKPIKLTSAGKRMLRYAEEIVNLNEKMRDALADHSQFSGVLKIGVIEIVTLTWLPEFVKALKKHYPNAIFEIYGRMSSELIEEFYNDDLDIIFILGLQNEPHAISVPICNYSLSWIANPKYFQFDKEMDITSLGNYPIILTRKSSSPYPFIRDVLLSYGMESVYSEAQQVKLDCAYSATTAIQLVEAGVGIMPMVRALVMDKLEQGTLCEIPLRQSLPPFTITACYKKANSNDFTNEVIALAHQCSENYCKNMAKDVAWI